jgi:hypothetical protein
MPSLSARARAWPAAVLRSRWTFEVALAAALLALAITRTDLRDVGAAFARARYGWAMLAVLIYALSRILHTVHWQFYLRKVGRVPLRGLLGAFLIGNFVDNVLPARIGEIARIQIVANRYGLSRAGMVAGRAAEALLDGVTTIALLVVAVVLFRFAFAPAALFWIVATFIAATFAALALASRLLPRELPDWPLLGRLRSRPRRALSDAWPRIRDGLEALRNARLLAIVLALTVAGYAMETVMFWTFGLAFRLGLPLSAYVSVVVAAGVVRVFPITFQNIGTYEVVLLEVLARQGAPRDAAFAYALATRVFASIAITTMGLLAMWLMRVHPRDLFTMRRRDPAESAGQHYS